MTGDHSGLNATYTHEQLVPPLGLACTVPVEMPLKVLEILTQRAHYEYVYRLRTHPDVMSSALPACFVHLRMIEAADDTVRTPA
jgi:hypothetical protein